MKTQIVSLTQEMHLLVSETIAGVSPENYFKKYSENLAICALQKFLIDVGVITENTNSIAQKVSKNGEAWLQLISYSSIGCLYTYKGVNNISRPLNDEGFDGFFVIRFNVSKLEVQQATEVEILGFTPDYARYIDLNSLGGLEDFKLFIEERSNNMPETGDLSASY